MSTLTLVVTEQTCTGKDSFGITSRVRQVLVYSNEIFRPFHTMRRFPEFDRCELVFLFGKRYINARLRPKVHDAVMFYLREKHFTQDMDFKCYDFVCRCVEPNKGTRDVKWDGVEWSGRPKIGDVIFLQNEKSRVSHYAIYIGSNRYLSVWGCGGYLQVATLDDMKWTFKPTIIEKLVVVQT